jgi:hypothetical protein
MSIIKLSAQESALMVLKALEQRGQRRGKELTRARISGATLKLLGNRETITPQWIDEINEWLLSAGWILINGGSTYAAIKVSVIENWPRVAVKKHLATELAAVKRGKFDFKSLSYLLKPVVATVVVATKRKVGRRPRKNNDGDSS